MSLLWLPLDHAGPGWPAAVDALWARLAPGGEPLLPDYFVKTTFVKMGGRLLELYSGDALLGAGLLFPRGLSGGARRYTLRLHPLAGLPADAELDRALAALLAPDTATLYRPADGRSFRASHAELGGFDIGAPGAAELPVIRQLHGAIWGGGAEARYPDDLHSAEFGPGTSLVARRDGRLAGFLLGFHRFGGLDALAALGPPHRTEHSLESQVMGVDAAFRRFGLAATLKRAQAHAALDRGVNVIHWTADPLQFANAVLNFGKLRAVAGALLPAYYPFQNELNRVAASRLSITWLLDSAHGRAGLEERPAAGRDLSRFPGVAVLSDGLRQLREPGGAPHIAIEIPADWTALQRDDPARAAEWRAASDAILAAQLGFAPGRYLVVDAAAEGDRRYLVASRFTLALVDP
jgi:predicted GNAT superfamily acetyltransferase